MYFGTCHLVFRPSGKCTKSPARNVTGGLPSGVMVTSPSITITNSSQVKSQSNLPAVQSHTPCVTLRSLDCALIQIRATGLPSVIWFAAIGKSTSFTADFGLVFRTWFMADSFMHSIAVRQAWDVGFPQMPTGSIHGADWFVVSEGDN